MLPECRGGVAYVLDDQNVFESRCNRAMVDLLRLEAVDEIEALRALIQRHGELTLSGRAKDILEAWDQFVPLFWKVQPLPPVPPSAPLASNNVPVAPSPVSSEIPKP